MLVRENNNFGHRFLDIGVTTQAGLVFIILYSGLWRVFLGLYITQAELDKNLPNGRDRFHR